MKPVYTVRRAVTPPPLDAAWEGPEWREVASLNVAHFHPESSAHRPRTEAKLVYDAAGLYGMFRVEDRYVVCAHTAYQSPVCRDSCVEFFVRPRPDKGYMNFEMNCCGALLLYYIEDPTRTPDGFAKFTKVPADVGGQVGVRGTFDGPNAEEIAEPVVWTLTFRIPITVLEAYVGALGDPSGQEWAANFYKCADGSSHPHWGAWASIGEQLNFHQPECFGALCFV
ncbi:MAG TPA: carbohydrate-binding family 9-like protein [Candidatus Hydrogenedentes bacterium]|nr:carbohydrate-binding family 9-like protein [Candidatus Hydrogenedentota bacterium]